ncbi:hypothetical protein GCM10011533_16350 [Streptosporangium jomthongense]|uniref:SprT-like domain-containing protein n=1 Tax=Marinobacter aromaticivorans TaxID=1494078 RepID=A0ABW2IUZ8_9GAMM|nr:hypothetical protein [Marinobacter aromaticivorans]GGE64731.1 hypothetical protein GCM10011533_16350 [Streptosporangium jomthongense]
MNSPKSQVFKLGELMCAITEQVLWQPVASRIQEQTAGSTLVCRVGSGQATYHRFDPSCKQHQITYGVRMIQAKHHSDAASGWLSSREIHSRGYFDGELNTLNLLAHTCCHEFAHLLQHSAGHRYRGSVHNRHFYTILDSLHESGEANALRRTLAQRAQQLNIHLPEQPFKMPDFETQKTTWSVGEAVRFGHGQREFEGEISRVNRKTCTVDGTGNCRGLRYRVPMQMLRRTS